ncbi:nitrite reductase (NADH) large subunit [Paenibacillus anaericanus]|uniref:NAD(P)/FAD-dependent oxidoreductase n=1 Tax=Paenibacillus anaericanus TaxID=170367 RepID=UPI002789D6EC|nr:FAD-dependent oxidoreductase [Paenibacillus anaericanus]MDQ0087587.1 nitrite reductase (NADH) large subunit [Paenibacillus anaericanus]
MTKNYCIVGTGVAAVNAAKAIRDQDPEGNILVFGSEDSLPYNRIKLSKDLYGDLRSEKVLIKKEAWYQKQQIQTFPNTAIMQIDVEEHVLVTSAGERISYDKLLICTGAKNRKLPLPGFDKQGVYTIREMHEAEAFKSYIEDKSNIVNIGGGIQGLETAWSIVKAGKKVTILEAAPRLMARQLDEKASSILKQKLEAAGVDVRLQAAVQQVVGEESVAGIQVNESTISCDSVIYSIGVIPNLDLVANTAVTTRQGIIVNDYMETNIPDVYAAGDVTEWKGTVEGLWDRAMDQGKVAGKNMASQGTEVYRKSIPLTVFNAFDLALFSMGLVDESQCDTTLLEEDDATGKYTRLFIANQTLIGVISFESVIAAAPYKTVIESQVSLVGLDLPAMSIQEVMAVVKERLATPVTA